MDELEKCRWCGRMTTMLNCGRCSDCDNHFDRHRVRMARHGKFISFAILLLIALTSANSCIFDTNLGRLSCLPSENTTLKSVNATSDIIPSYSYLKTNMTPDIWRNKLIDGLKRIINGSMNITNFTVQQAQAALDSMAKQSEPRVFFVGANITSANSTQTAPKPVSQNLTGASGTPACQNERERDWQAYCQTNLMGFDCWNANAETKAMIMKNMAAIKGCKYVR